MLSDRSEPEILSPSLVVSFANKLSLFLFETSHWHSAGILACWHTTLLQQAEHSVVNHEEKGEYAACAARLLARIT